MCMPCLVDSAKLRRVLLAASHDVQVGRRRELPEHRLVGEHRDSVDFGLEDARQRDLAAYERVVLQDHPLVGEAKEAGADALAVVDRDEVLTLDQVALDVLELFGSVKDRLGHAVIVDPQLHTRELMSLSSSDSKYGGGYAAT